MMLSSSALLAKPAMPPPMPCMPFVLVGRPPGRGCVSRLPIICAAVGFIFGPPAPNAPPVIALPVCAETPPVCEFTGIPGGKPGWLTDPGGRYALGGAAEPPRYDPPPPRYDPPLPR